VDGAFSFKLDKGEGVEKALIPEGKVKAWFDEQGLGALRPGDAPHGGELASAKEVQAEEGPEPEQHEFDHSEVGFITLSLLEAGDEEKPLAGAAYKLVGGTEYSGKADDGGHVQHAGVPLENYELQVEGYQPVHVPAFLDADDVFVARVRKA